MNIFALSRCPVESAQQMIDKHVVKMPTESCQMLHTNILYMLYKFYNGVEPTLSDLKLFHNSLFTGYKQAGPKLMKPAMLNHPSTIWARKSLDNFTWLLHHAEALCQEYTFRYRKTHGTEQRIFDCESYFDVVNNHDYPENILSPVDIAMADEYRLPKEKHSWDFVIRSYRHYYREGKWSFAYWLRRDNPDWFPVSFIVSKIRGE